MSSDYDRFYMVGWDSVRLVWYSTLDSPSWAAKNGWPEPVARGLSADVASVLLLALANGFGPDPDDPDDGEPACLLRLREASMKPLDERAPEITGPRGASDANLAAALEHLRRVPWRLAIGPRDPLVGFVENRIDLDAVITFALAFKEKEASEIATAPLRDRYDRGERSAGLLAAIRRL